MLENYNEHNWKNQTSHINWQELISIVVFNFEIPMGLVIWRIEDISIIDWVMFFDVYKCCWFFQFGMTTTNVNQQIQWLIFKKNIWLILDWLMFSFDKFPESKFIFRKKIIVILLLYFLFNVMFCMNIIEINVDECLLLISLEFKII